MKRTIYSNIIRYVYAGHRDKAGRNLDKLRLRIIKAAQEQTIKREIEMCCLLCGKDLSKQIMERKIRLHFCKHCRVKLIEKQVMKAAKRMKRVSLVDVPNTDETYLEVEQ